MGGAHCNTLQHALQHTATRAATHCKTLQPTATNCNTPRHTAAHCSALQHTATHCYTQQHTVAHCSTLQRAPVSSRVFVRPHSSYEGLCAPTLEKSVGAQKDVSTLEKTEAIHLFAFKTRCNTLQHAATRCNTLQHTATHCNSLQHTATLRNTLQYTTRHTGILKGPSSTRKTKTVQLVCYQRRVHWPN